MQILMQQFIKPFLVKYSLIPKSVSFNVKLRLEMTCKHFLYLTSIRLLPIKREKHKQMLLRRCQYSSSHI